MLSLLLWALILWACFGCGAALLRRLRASCDGLAEEAPFAIALGMGLLSLLVLAAGLLGHLQVWVGVALVLLLALLGWRETLRLPRALLAGARALPLRASGAPLAVLFALLGGLTLLGALAPSSDATGDFDGLFYHLTLPKLYLLHGRISPLPWLTHSNFPFLQEMLYLLGLMLHGQALAKLFHFGCGWLTALALFSFGRRFWTPRAGALGAAAFVTTPFVVWEMVSAYNELAFALYAFLALYALARWYETRASGWLWSGALCCGFALGAKLLALVVPLFIVGALLLTLLREPHRGRALLRIAAFAGLALLVASPWYLKSYLWTGNPVYPFFYEVFGGKWWTLQRAQEYAAAQHAFGLGTGPVQFLALPWNLTMHPKDFTDRGFNPLIASLGPLPLAFLPLLLLWWRRATGAVAVVGVRPSAGAQTPLGTPSSSGSPSPSLERGPGGEGAPALRLALAFALLYTALWFVMSQNSRYLIPLLPGLCAASGLTADRLLSRRGLTSAVTSVAYALVALLALGVGLLLAGPSARAAVGLESPADYLSRTSAVYTMAQAVNAATPSTAKLMILGDEPRWFYLDRDFFLGNHAAIFSAQELASPAALRAALQQRGVTHLLIHESTMANVRARSGTMEPGLAALIDAHQLRFVKQIGPMSLWELAPARK